MSLASLQVRERSDGQTVRAVLALCDGRGILIRSDTTGKNIAIHVLRRQNSNSAVQMLNPSFHIIQYNNL